MEDRLGLAPDLGTAAEHQNGEADLVSRNPADLRRCREEHTGFFIQTLTLVDPFQVVALHAHRTCGYPIHTQTDAGFHGLEKAGRDYRFVADLQEGVGRAGIIAQCRVVQICGFGIAKKIVHCPARTFLGFLLRGTCPAGLLILPPVGTGLHNCLGNIFYDLFCRQHLSVPHFAKMVSPSAAATMAGKSFT